MTFATFASRCRDSSRGVGASALKLDQPQVVNVLRCERKWRNFRVFALQSRPRLEFDLSRTTSFDLCRCLDQPSFQLQRSSSCDLKRASST